jgi:TPR repeat protein
MYDLGRGVQENGEKAIQYYATSAATGFPYGQFALGSVYEYRRGTNKAKDYETAATWFRLAAEQGEPHAQTALGLCYSNGRGVPKGQPQALKWYQRAADQGFPLAQYRLANFYEIVERDFVQAEAWYLAAAAKGHIVSQNRAAYIMKRLSMSQLEEARSLEAKYRLRQRAVAAAE